jgi:hypothetical protein
MMSSNSSDSIQALITQVTIQESHKADRTQYLAALRNEESKLNEALAEVNEKIDSYNEELHDIIKCKIPLQIEKNNESEGELFHQQVIIQL